MKSMREQPIRVAMVMGKMHGGGVEAVVMNYYRHIDHCKVQFDFLVDADSTLVPREEIEAFGGRVFEIPPYQRIVEYQCALIQLFRQEGWEIVHSHINALSVFSLRAAKKAGVPVRIAHSHSTSGKGEYAKNAAKWVLRRFSNIYPTRRIACSDKAGRWLFGEGRDYTLFYNAIDLDSFAFDAEKRRRTRDALGITEATFVVGHIGRFMTQKNHAFLIAAFAKLVELKFDSLLLLAGDGELMAQAEELALKLEVADKVRFLGYRSDPDCLYQAFDCFALPSLYEGLPLVAVEAQRAGLRCLLSTAITREVALTDGAEFHDIDSADEWARALKTVSEKHERIDARAELFAAYNIEDAAQRLQSYYYDLISGVRYAQ